MKKINRLWERINYLVPEPQCRTFDHDYDKIDWKDSRAKPTIQELESLTDKQLNDSEKETDSRNKMESPENKFLTKLLFDMENRLRSLEGNSPISKDNFKKELISKLKGL